MILYCNIWVKEIEYLTNSELNQKTFLITLMRSSQWGSLHISSVAGLVLLPRTHTLSFLSSTLMVISSIWSHGCQSSKHHLYTGHRYNQQGRSRLDKDWSFCHSVLWGSKIVLKSPKHFSLHFVCLNCVTCPSLRLISCTWELVKVIDV